MRTVICDTPSAQYMKYKLRTAEVLAFCWNAINCRLNTAPIWRSQPAKNTPSFPKAPPILTSINQTWLKTARSLTMHFTSFQCSSNGKVWTPEVFKTSTEYWVWPPSHWQMQLSTWWKRKPDWILSLTGLGFWPLATGLNKTGQT